MLTQVWAWGGNPPPAVILGTATMLGCDRAPPWFALRRGMKQYPGPHGPKSNCLSFRVTYACSRCRTV